MIEMKEKTNKITIIVEEFNILLLLVNRTWRKSGKNKDLNIIKQFSLIDTYRTLHTTAVEHTFTSSTQENSPR